ncbi:hypothetical protein PFISCL1PPCAC_8180, partial [Pristionchus fissidentatus]
SPFARLPIVREGLHETLLRSIKEHAKRQQGRAAFINVTHSGATLTFEDVHKQSLSVAGFLQSIGFAPGDVAAATLPNSNEWPVYCIGVWACGGIVTLASSAFTSYELEKQLINSSASIVFTNDVNLEKTLFAVKNSPKVKTVIVLRTSDDAPLPSDVIEWTAVIAAPPIKTIVKVDPDTTAILPYSSGTTGAPKGVMMSHRAFNTMIKQMME